MWSTASLMQATSLMVFVSNGVFLYALNQRTNTPLYQYANTPVHPYA
jgi:hypothetical protein